MPADEQQELLVFFQRAIEYSDRLMQIIEDNLDVAEELPPATEVEAVGFLSQFQDLEPDFYNQLKDALTTQIDYRLSEEAYSMARQTDLLRRQDEIVRDYEELHRDAALVDFLKTDFYYDAAIFEWRALMLALAREGSDRREY
jgi:hypothetical protein